MVQASVHLDVPRPSHGCFGCWQSNDNVWPVPLTSWPVTTGPGVCVPYQKKDNRTGFGKAAGGPIFCLQVNILNVPWTHMQWCLGA